ncbi:MAG: glycosyltransferase family 4 protein [Akkermansiaceae bacterium]|nr:glycosyltransferase family 4 protein [Armatimonadota bacterium]
MSSLILPSIPETLFEASAPRRDFLMLAETLGGSLLYPVNRDADSLLSRLEKRTATDVRQAFAALKRRRSVSVYVSLSEKVGIPLALLLPKSRHDRPAHILVGHRLTSPNKRQLQERTGYLHRFDRVIVLATTQSLYLTQEARYPAHRVTFVFDSVDTKFWFGSTPPFGPPAPPELGAGGPKGGYLLAVGRERRDYETLASAVRQLPDLGAVVVASSPWSRATTAIIPGEIPPNMTLRKNLSPVELRGLYADASLVVVPLLAGTDYAAGVNACLEAMAMAKPVLATATPGLANYCRGDSGEELLATVPAGEPVGQLRAAIESLFADPTRCTRLARAGRQFAEQKANVDTYVASIASVVQDSLTER